MNQDSDKDNILKHILCADNNTRNAPVVINETVLNETVVIKDHVLYNLTNKS